LTVPITGPFTVYSVSPIPQLGSVALTAQFIGFLEIHQFTVSQVQHITVPGIMAIQAPAVLFRMMKNDIFVSLQLPAPGIGFLALMTIRAREDTFRKGRRRHLDFQALPTLLS
jgi:hypothetical protein